jgi:hypothetical protein
MAFAAVATLFTAEAVTSAMVLSAMAEVGTVMTVVGAVTGNKDLMKVGGAVGLIGGIGGLVNGAAGAGALSTTVPTEAQAAAQPALDVGSQAVTDSATGLTTTEPAIQAANDIAVPQLPESGVEGVQGFQPPSADTGYTGPAGAQGPEAVADVGAKFATQPTTDATKGSSFFENIWNGIKDPKNKELVNMGAKVVGGLFEGAQKSGEFNQKMALENSRFDYQKQLDSNVNNQNQSRSGIIQLAKKA